MMDDETVEGEGDTFTLPDANVYFYGVTVAEQLRELGC